MALTSLAAAAALFAAWAPSPRFSLVCQGTQTGYQEANPVKLTTPWAEIIAVDLVAGTYCSRGCVKSEPIATVGAATLDLANSSVAGGSSLKRFQVASGAYSSAEVTGGGGPDHFHLERTGTCTLTP